MTKVTRNPCAHLMRFLNGLRAAYVRFFSLLVHFFTVLCETNTSLSKDDVDSSENVVKKRDFGLIH